MGKSSTSNQLIIGIIGGEAAGAHVLRHLIKEDMDVAFACASEAEQMSEIASAHAVPFFTPYAISSGEITRVIEKKKSIYSSMSICCTFFPKKSLLQRGLVASTCIQVHSRNTVGWVHRAGRYTMASPPCCDGSLDVCRS